MTYGFRSNVIAPHVVSVLVTPAVPIVASTAAVATVIETLSPHSLVSGDTVAIAGHVGSTPPIDGSHVVTVLDALHVSIPVTVTIPGTGGAVTRELAAEPLTIDDGKLRAGLDWAPGDPRDALMRSFIASARSKVERDTGLALLLQTRDVYLDALPGWSASLRLPAQCMPLQSVTSISSIDTAGVVHELDPEAYLVDLVSGRIGLATGSVWPRTNVRSFQPYVLRIVAGWPSVARLTAEEPMLVHLVGRLTAHYATLGRDLASGDPASEVPFGYEDDIASYRPVVVA